MWSSLQADDPLNQPLEAALQLWGGGVAFNEKQTEKHFKTNNTRFYPTTV